MTELRADLRMKSATPLAEPAPRAAARISAAQPHKPSPHPCSLQIISTMQGLDELAPQWDALYSASPAASPPLRWVWVRRWWDIFGSVYGDAGRGLRVLAIRRDEQLIGVLPLYRQIVGLARLRRLRFISTGAAEFEETCAEYLGLLHGPGCEQDCVAAVAAALIHPPAELAWDELDLADMADDAALLQLEERLDGLGRVQLRSPGVCYISDLQGGVEPYLMRLSPGTRKKARKFLRDLEKPELMFEIATTAEQANVFFDQLVDLHRKRWQQAGKSGSFSQRHAAFHRALCVALVPRGEVMLARLSSGGVPVALTYGHRVNERFDAYQMGVARDTTSVHSPGTMVFLGLMTHLANDGVVSYDHLLGFNRFKQDYAKKERAIRSLRITRRNARARVHEGLDWVSRGMRKTLKLLRPGSASPCVAAASGDDSADGKEASTAGRASS